MFLVWGNIAVRHFHIGALMALLLLKLGFCLYVYIYNMHMHTPIIWSFFHLPVLLVWKCLIWVTFILWICITFLPDPSLIWGVWNSFPWYCWWKKSQTTTWDVQNPVNLGIFTISTGDPPISEPSTVANCKSKEGLSLKVSSDTDPSQWLLVVRFRKVDKPKFQT